MDATVSATLVFIGRSPGGASDGVPLATQPGRGNQARGSEEQSEPETGRGEKICRREVRKAFHVLAGATAGGERFIEEPQRPVREKRRDVRRVERVSLDHGDGEHRQ